VICRSSLARPAIAAFRKYKSDAEKLERERSALKLKIKCEVGTGIGGAVTAGTIAQVQTAIGAATVLLAGCVYALQKIKDSVS
jgi:hypothetical protein